MLLPLNLFNRLSSFSRINGLTHLIKAAHLFLLIFFVKPHSEFLLNFELMIDAIANIFEFLKFSFLFQFFHLFLKLACHFGMV